MKKLLLLTVFIISMYSFSQENKDTLFIKYDYKLLTRNQDPTTEEFYYLIEDSQKGSEGMYFLEKKIYKKGELCTHSKKYSLRKIIEEAGAFSEKDRYNFLDTKFFYYLSKMHFKKCYLVKKDSFIDVDIIHEVE